MPLNWSRPSHWRTVPTGGVSASSRARGPVRARPWYDDGTFTFVPLTLRGLLLASFVSSIGAARFAAGFAREESGGAEEASVTASPSSGRARTVAVATRAAT